MLALRRSAFTSTVGADVGRSVAVAHLHGLGIAHRDLKPENVLLDHTGHVVLTDFGLAKRVKGDSHTNSMCGTMEYMVRRAYTPVFNPWVKRRSPSRAAAD